MSVDSVTVTVKFVKLITLPAGKKERLQFPMEVHNIALDSLILVMVLLENEDKNRYY